MRKRLHPRDRLWFLADPNLDQLIIRCEIILDGVIDQNLFQNLVIEKLVNKYDKFKWVIDSYGQIKISTEIEKAYHFSLKASDQLVKDKPLWKFELKNENNTSIIVFQIHHCLVDGLSLVAILKELSNEFYVTSKTSQRIRKINTIEIPAIFSIAFGVLITFFRVIFSKTIKLYNKEKNYLSSIWQKQPNNPDITEFGLILEKVAREKTQQNKLLLGIPVSLVTNHKRVRSGLGNFFAFVPLTVKEDKHVYSDLQSLKKKGEVLGTYIVSLLIGTLPLKIGNYFARFISSHIYGVVSGVFVSSHALEVLGVRVNRINAWAPILEGQKFSVTTVSYNNQITVNELERI